MLFKVGNLDHLCLPKWLISIMLCCTAKIKRIAMMHAYDQEFAEFSVFFLPFQENSIDLVRASIGPEAEGILKY